MMLWPTPNPITPARLKLAAKFADNVRFDPSAAEAILARGGIHDRLPDHGQRRREAEILIRESTLCAFSLFAEIKATNERYCRLDHTSGDAKRTLKQVSRLHNQLDSLIRRKPCWVDLSAIRMYSPGNNIGNRLLNIALLRGYHEFARAMIDGDAPLTGTGLCLCPFGQAISLGNHEAVIQMLEKGVDANTIIKTPGFSSSNALQMACTKFVTERTQVIKALLKHGADPNGITDEDPVPAIHQCQKPEQIALLAAYGANPNFCPPGAIAKPGDSRGISIPGLHTDKMPEALSALLDAGMETSPGTPGEHIRQKVGTELRQTIHTTQGLGSGWLMAPALMAAESVFVEREKQAQARWKDIDDSFEKFARGEAELPIITARDIVWATNIGQLDQAMSKRYWQHYTPEHIRQTLSDLPLWYMDRIAFHYPWIGQRMNEAASAPRSWQSRITATAASAGSEKSPS